MDNIQESSEWEALVELAQKEKRHENWVELGRQLYKIEKACRGAGTFPGICEALGLKGRTGYYLAQIVQKLDRLCIDPPVEVHWTKLKDLIGILSIDNQDEIFDLCMTKTRRELGEYIFNEIEHKLPI